MTSFRIKKMLRSVFLVVAGLSLSGGSCFSTPPKEEFFYSLKSPSALKESVKGARISVASFTAAAGYDSTRVAYRTAQREMRYYGYRQWVAEPPRIIAEATMRYLRSSGMFREVDMGDRVREPDLILEGNVDAMEEIEEGQGCKAHLALTLRLRDARSDKVVLEHAFDSLLVCARRHPQEVAARIGEILQKQITALAPRIAGKGKESDGDAADAADAGDSDSKNDTYSADNSDKDTATKKDSE
jgi:ABC-type uncharacterized transport system auxiliary subunit